MKVGDKVRFLNTTGGGIVKGFQGKDVAIVEDDGFDTPVLIRECVIIESANETQVRQSSKATPDIIQQAFVEKAIDENYVVEETKEGEEITLCIGYLPNDIKNLSTSNYDCYLINDSNYYLSYAYMNRTDDGWNIRTTGTIEPNTKLFLEEFSKEDLNQLERIAVQFIAYKQAKSFALKNPCLVDLRIDTVKFYKLHSFRENDYFDENALIYYIVRHDRPEKELNISAEELQQAILQKETSQRDVKQRIKKKEKPIIIEIDLHANEILDNTAGLSTTDIFKYQMKTFNEVMSANIQQKGQKIVFIHGKGDGVLKNAILKELKTKYKMVYFQDASFQEYGYGATMVTIK